MRSALIVVAVAALMGGLVIAPATQQSAKAQAFGGVKSGGTTNGDNLVTLVGRGGGGRDNQKCGINRAPKSTENCLFLIISTAATGATNRASDLSGRS